MKNMFVINFGKKSRREERKDSTYKHYYICCMLLLKKNEKKWRPTSNPVDRGNEEFTLTKQS